MYTANLGAGQRRILDPQYRLPTIAAAFAAPIALVPLAGQAKALERGGSNDQTWTPHHRFPHRLAWAEDVCTGAKYRCPGTPG
jgi:hypothetical protein